jgi:ferrous iron transport protein B
MWAMFHFTFEASAVFMSMIEVVISNLAELARQIPDPLISSLLGDGIIGGVGFILVFVPPIFFMYLSISVLEDSGYLARAAFVMDRLMVRMGLHGRSFIPMLLGFGCSVPGIMAARTVEGEGNRLTTILVTPLMSCSARLPVYVLIGGAFFPEIAGTVIFLLYLTGIFFAVLMSLIFKRFAFKGQSSPFIMELPMYQLPTFHGSFIHMWDRGVLFLKKAGTYLLVGAVILWTISAIGPTGFGVSIDESYLGLLGQVLAPIFAPIGFDWRIVSALIFGLFAKEVFVETLGIIYAVEGDVALGTALAGTMTPVVAFAVLLFVLLYTPCVAALGTVKKETGSWKWTLVSVVYQLILAYLVAFVFVSIAGIFV